MSYPAVVGLDLSLRSTGIAYADGHAGLVVAPETLRGMERVELVLDAVRLALDCGEERDADLVVIEGYSYNTTHAAHVLAELGGIVRWELWRSGIPYMVMAPGALKRYATGNGGCDKDAMVDAAKTYLGLVPAKRKGADDMADALWLRAAGLHRLGRPLSSVLVVLAAEDEMPQKRKPRRDAVALIEAMPIIERPSRDEEVPW
jgi:Holliday junction resolvasome RuvABC endonuclease subunit